MARIWNVRFNLDQANADLVGSSDAEAAAWLRGFLVGAQGRKLDGCHHATAGNAMGLASHEECREFGRKQAERINKRWHPSDTTVLPRNNHGNSTVIPAVIPIHNPQSTIEQPQTNNHAAQQAAPSVRKRLDYPEDFEAFWKAYPRREGKMNASREWAKLSDDDRKLASGLLSEWIKGKDPKYMPHAERYLKNARWTDEAPKAVVDPSTLSWDDQCDLAAANICKALREKNAK